MSRKIPPPDPFVRHPETESLVEVLREFDEGELRTYETLSAEAGFDVRGAHHYLRSARKILLREDGYVFECVPGHGVKRLGDQAKVTRCDGLTTRISRQAKRTTQELATVDLANLSRDGLILANALLAQGGAVLAVTGKGAQKRLCLTQAEEPKAISAEDFAESTRDLIRRRLGNKSA